jgi:hypothetical protein
LHTSLVRLTRLATAIATCTLFACASSSTSSPDIEDGGASSLQSSGDCNAVAQLGAQVTGVSTKEPAPAPLGGAIVDGTYMLTSAKIHNPQLPEGTQVTALGASTFEFTGDKAVVVSTDDKGVVSRRNETYIPSGTSVDVTVTCSFVPANADAGTPPIPAGYTSTPTTFTHYLKQPGGTIVEVVLTKQ